MPLHQTLLLFLIGLTVAALAENVRPELKRPAFWVILLLISAALSVATVLIARTRHSGTGFTTNHGWPKPFYFEYLSEVGQQSRELNAVYMTANSLAFAGVLLIVWTVIHLFRR